MRSKMPVRTNSLEGDAKVSDAVNVAKAGNHKVTTWQFIWCYEHSQASENHAQRQLIKKVAGAVGAVPLFLKKASQFAKWLEQPNRQPYVLVTGWREAQPCGHAVCEHSGSDMRLPIQMVVLCDLRRQITRATNWAKVLRRDLRVHVCERSSIPDFLLDGVIKQCFAAVDPNLSSKGVTPVTGGDSSCSASDTTSTVGDYERLPPYNTSYDAVFTAPKRELTGNTQGQVDDLMLMQLYAQYLQVLDLEGLPAMPTQASKLYETYLSHCGMPFAPLQGEQKIIALAHMSL